MIRIICSECKNAYLKKEDGNLTCPSCRAVFPEDAENLLLGAQYYGEGDFSQANDYLMKYIVKNGADPRAMFYKALCDGFSFDEDTASLNGMYEKLLDSLSEIPDGEFVRYLALANDESEKLEKLVGQTHVKQFENADSEKIKKEVSTIINFQNSAKEFRAKLTDLAHAYNERSAEQLSVKFSSCYLVQPETAAEIGTLKFEKVKESIESHTVFTGILSNEIKNLEIYYRCIVMFFEKDRQKYDFLMESAEKFNDIAKLLEGGRYTSVKGVPTIANKLKSAAYDFFQESLKDHEDEFEQQTETVVVTIPEPAEEPVEESAEASAEASAEETVVETSTEPAEDSAEETVSEPAEETSVAEDITETEESAEEVAETEVIEKSDIPEESAEETVVETAEETSTQTLEDSTEETVCEPAEETSVTEDVGETEESAEEVAEEPVEEVDAEETVIEIPVSEDNSAEDNSADVTDSSSESDEISADESPVTDETEVSEKTPVKHKKSFAPFVAVIVVIFAIIGLIAVKVVPDKLNESNYKKATALATEKKYAEAAEVFAELGSYEDAEEKTLECRYNNACALEEAEKYAEAKAIFFELSDYKDSVAKKNSCIYKEALAILDAGKYDEAAQVFKSLDGYADSATMIKECSYKKASSLTVAKDYEGAIALFEKLGDYSDSETKILEAKYGYVTSNLDAENETTLTYLKDLARAKYKDSADLRNKLLGTDENLSAGVTSCVNYSLTDTKTALSELDRTKVAYFHVVVTKAELYGKKLTVDYRTSMGYHDTKDIVLTENQNTYAFPYPSTDVSGYTVEFKLLSDSNETLTSQEISVN